VGGHLHTFQPAAYLGIISTGLSQIQVKYVPNDFIPSRFTTKLREIRLNPFITTSVYATPRL
jgi:hypothetical protein